MATSTSQHNKVLRCHTYPDHYSKVINTYYEHNNRRESLGKWTDKEFECYVVKDLSTRFSNTLGNEPLCVLGIGSSEGKFTDALSSLGRIKTLLCIWPLNMYLQSNIYYGTFSADRSSNHVTKI